MTMLGTSCATCRRDLHCGRCACCMPEAELARKVKRIAGVRGVGSCCRHGCAGCVARTARPGERKK